MQQNAYATDKAQSLMAALDDLSQDVPASAPSQAPTPMPETTLDMALINTVEASVRAALALFDVDYDSYINYAPTAAYGLALANNPGLVKQIEQAEMPVVEALKIALTYAPYAEFATKYGSTPDEIRAAIRKELEAEMSAKTAPQNSDTTRESNSRTPLFSAMSGAAAPKAAGSEPKSGLDALFNRR